MPSSLCLYALSIAVEDAKNQISSANNNFSVSSYCTNTENSARIEEYTRTLCIKKDAPYSYAAVYTWFEEAAAHYGVDCPLPPSVLISDVFNEFNSRHLIRSSAKDACPGDIVLFWIPQVNRYGHIGLVLNNPTDGTLRTVEANIQTETSYHYGVDVAVRQVTGTKHCVINMQGFLSSDGENKTRAIHLPTVPATVPIDSRPVASPLTLAVDGVSQSVHSAYFINGAAYVPITLLDVTSELDDDGKTLTVHTQG